MKYLIKVEQKKPCGKHLGDYSQTVEGEPVIIPGFEQIKLFAHKITEEDFDCWGISEITTGLAIVHYDDCIPTKDMAIVYATLKMAKKGLQYVLDTIKTCQPVESFPLFKEKKK